MPKQKTYDAHGMEVGFGEGIDPASWRDQPDPDLQHATEEQLDNDENTPTPDYVKELLGFDPDDDEDDDDLDIELE